MIYNGFVVLDTHDTPMEMMAGGESNYGCGNESNYEFPALPGGGTGTAPTTAGWSVTGGGSAGTTTPSTTTGGKINWSNVLNQAPQVLGTLGAVAGTVKGIRGSGGDTSGDPITMACGKRPLLLPGKKRAWDQCAASVMAAQQEQQKQKEGMSTTAKVLIGVGILVFLIIMVVLIIMISKRQTK
jgi:hypothetical protein